MKQFAGPFDNLETDILAGMANLVWWEAWAHHQDELHEEGLPHANLAGAEIAHVADDPSEIQRIDIENHVKAVRKKIEAANHAKLPTLYKRAIEANRKAAEKEGTPYIPGARASEDQFGSCLAHMSMGTGVSWFDDNEKFDLEVPYSEYGSCYLTWEGPDADTAIKAYLARTKKSSQDPEELLQLLTEFLDDKKLGGDLHEFLLTKTGGRR